MTGQLAKFGKGGAWVCIERVLTVLWRMGAGGLVSCIKAAALLRCACSGIGGLKDMTRRDVFDIDHRPKPSDKGLQPERAWCAGNQVVLYDWGPTDPGPSTRRACVSVTDYS